MTTLEPRAARVELILLDDSNAAPFTALVDLLADAMHWCPRQIPSIGTRPASSRITSILAGASAGPHGPGDKIT